MTHSMSNIILHTLLAKLPENSPTPVLLGSFSTKAGNFREIGWQLIVREANKLQEGSQRAYLAQDYTFHLIRYQNVLILCLTNSSTSKSQVGDFLQVVHSQYLVTLEKNSRRKRKTKHNQQNQNSQGLHDDVASMLQRCMTYHASSNKHKQLLLSTRTRSRSKMTDTNRSNTTNTKQNISRNSRSNRTNTGMLLPMGFGNASSGTASHSLDSIDPQAKSHFLRDIENAETTSDYYHILHDHRGILLHLNLPNTKPTTEEQAFKDSVRETFLLNGQPMEGHRALDLMRNIEAMTAPFAFSVEARAKTALDVLRAASRTTTGGDSYFLTSTLFARPGVMVTAGYVACHLPIEIQSTKRGQIIIKTHNRYELHDEESMMTGDIDDREAMIVLETETIETIDCITGNGKRILRITSNDITNLVLEYHIRGAGLPRSNGKYTRHGCEKIYVNKAGYFLTYLESNEKDIGGGRMQLEDHQWIIYKSMKDRICYRCNVNEGEEANQNEWVAVSNGEGVPPNPTIEITKRGYATLSREDIRALFVEENDDSNTTVSSLSSIRKNDLLTGVSPPRSMERVEDAAISSPGFEMLEASEEQSVVFGGVEHGGVEHVPKVNRRRASVILQNNTIMAKARACEERRRSIRK